MASAQGQQQDALKQIAQVSKLLRSAIADSLPVSGDQYMTISIPGTIIDTRDIGNGGTLVWDAARQGSAPLAVQQAEGRLVDGMMPISQIVLGNTGRSVARSYSRALDCLIPIQAPGTPGKESRASPGYEAAIKYLQKKDGDGKCPIDYYVEKQGIWAQAKTEWEAAKNTEMLRLERTVLDLGERQQAMNLWNQTHFREFKTNVQGKWMDWVVNGFKYGVENAFGTIDIESIMARIEKSKESLRDSTVVDANGVDEVPGVTLTPKQWARECQIKVNEWSGENGKYSLQQIHAEISRLKRLEISYRVLKAQFVARKFPIAPTPAPPAPAPPAPAPPAPAPPAPGQNPIAPDAALGNAFKALYVSQGQLNRDIQSNSNTQQTRTTVRQDENNLQTELGSWSEHQISEAKVILQTLPQNEVDAWIDGQLNKVARSIASLTTLANNKSNNSNMIPVIIGAKAATTSHGNPDPEKCSTEFAQADDALPNSIFNSPDAGSGSSSSSTDASPWTKIAFSYSAETFAQMQSRSSWDMSVSGGLNLGLLNMGGAYSHEQSQGQMYQDMAGCKVSISFQAMVVNVQRPWLHGELFSDAELDVADGIKLSPGPAQIQEWLKDVSNQSTRDSIAEYSMFPSYPTAFVVAANTVIEFLGRTSHIEEHFSQHSNSGSISVGYGPFNTRGNFHESASSSSVQLEVTTNGCKLKFGAPQIIAWVSQVLPKLKRPTGFNPMVTGFL